MELEKIIKTIKDQGITAYEIAQNTNLTEVGINKILNGKTKKPHKSTLKTLTDYITFTLKLDNNHKTKHTTEALNVDFTQLNVMHVPLVNKYAYAGYLNGFGDDEWIDELPKIPFANDVVNKGKYLCFEVKGDSMDDGSYESYLEGDILLCRNVRPDFWTSKLHIDKWDFVIVHKEQGILVKRITEHHVEKGLLTLHSLNEYYEDFIVDLREVAGIFNIVDFRRKKSRR